MIRAGGRDVLATPERGAIIDSDQLDSMLWRGDMEHLVVGIDRAVLICNCNAKQTF